jgi:hypothetical protein
VDHLITEDDTPVDNLFSERQMRLLCEALYVSWLGPGDGRPFLAAANVGLFETVRAQAVVPDVFLSLDVRPPEELWEKSHRSYFFWEYGKPPEVAIEVVSNTVGQEAGDKMRRYVRMGILYYVIWDPLDQLKQGRLRMLVLREKEYVPLDGSWLPVVGLGLTLWHGTYEGIEADWLRWCDANGQVLLTGAERAEQERQRADQERQRANQEGQRADQERQRAERLAARLRAMGVEPDANGPQP